MIVNDIRRTYSSLSATEQRVADYILADPLRVTQMSMAELAKQTGTSDASVMRMCKAVGQKGFYQLKINLAMESAEAAAQTELPQESDDVVAILDAMAANVSQVAKSVSLEQIKQCVRSLKEARTVYLFGWGNSNVIAEDLAHRLLRFGIFTFCSDNVEYIMRSVILADQRDLLVVVSHSGSSVYANECMRLARENGMTVMLLAGEKYLGKAKDLADIAVTAGVVNNVASGFESHVPEMVISDLILYFMDRDTERYRAGARSEAILGQFKE